MPAVFDDARPLPAGPHGHPVVSVCLADAGDELLVRSRNAGPFWLTIDVMFRAGAWYDRAACRCERMQPAALAQFLRVDERTLIVSKMAAVRTIEISYPRIVSAVAPGGGDTLGRHQYAAILDLTID